MFARLGMYQFHIDKLDEAVKRYEDRVIPAMKSLKGYRGAYMLSDRRTGKGISMTLWDSEEDAIADEQSGQFQERTSWFKDFFTVPPVREGYEVNAQS
jgi:heme-degrading monooxygenase HmoA